MNFTESTLSYCMIQSVASPQSPWCECFGSIPPYCFWKLHLTSKLCPQPLRFKMFNWLPFGFLLSHIRSTWHSVDTKLQFSAHSSWSVAHALYRTHCWEPRFFNCRGRVATTPCPVESELPGLLCSDVCSLMAISSSSKLRRETTHATFTSIEYLMQDRYVPIAFDMHITLIITSE